MNNDFIETNKNLELALSEFTANNTEENFVRLLVELSQSFVWVPCHARISDADQKRLIDMVNTCSDDLNELVDRTFTMQDEVRFVPDILQNEGEFFFPIFTSEEAMGDYGKEFSNVQKHIADVLSLARNNEKPLRGFVLNAFTEPFVLPSELWDFFERLYLAPMEEELVITEKDGSGGKRS